MVETNLILRVRLLGFAQLHIPRTRERQPRASEMHLVKWKYFQFAKRTVLPELLKQSQQHYQQHCFCLKFLNPNNFMLFLHGFCFHHQQFHQKILQSCQPAVISHDPKDHGGYIHRNLTNGHLFVISSSAASRMKRCLFYKKTPA